MSPAVVILNIAYIALLLATLARTITWLRFVLVCASIAFITFGILEGIWSMVAWNVLIGGMHLYWVIADQFRERSVDLSGRQLAVRDEFFPALSDLHFHAFWMKGTKVVVTDEHLIHNGQRPTTVSLILDGIAVIERSGEIVCGVRRGALLGEMSLVSGQASEVDVLARGKLVMRQWDQRAITKLDKENPEAARAFRTLLSQDLAAKARLA